MSSPDSRLEEALVLTQRMLELAKQDEWEEVKVLEEKQGSLLRDCFESGNPITDRAAVARTAQQILDLNQKIIAVSAESKDRIKAGLSQLQKGRTAIRAYLDHS